MTAREWRRPILSTLRKNPPENETKDRTMPGFGGELMEGEAGKQRRGGTRDGKTPQGLTGTWMQAKGGKRGSAPSWEMSADAGIRRRAQGRAAEAGGWRVRETSMWAARCTGRGGGDWVKKERSLTVNGYG